MGFLELQISKWLSVQIRILKIEGHKVASLNMNTESLLSINL